MDFFYLALLAVFFSLSILLVFGCKKLGEYS